MPQSVRSRITELGGLIPALENICDGLQDAAYISRGSTSSGLTVTATGHRIEGGSHHFVMLSDGSYSQQSIDENERVNEIIQMAWNAAIPEGHKQRAIWSAGHIDKMGSRRFSYELARLQNGHCPGWFLETPYGVKEMVGYAKDLAAKTGLSIEFVDWRLDHNTLTGIIIQPKPASHARSNKSY
jgi:hypothetical protein